MSTEWIEYQVMYCDAPGCRVQESIGGASASELRAEWPAWTMVQGRPFPSDDKHYCPIHKPEVAETRHCSKQG